MPHANVPERVQTYALSTQLSLQLAEFPRRQQGATCPTCGEGHYWHVTWPTSLLLARYLVAPARRRRLAGKRVLVIGCGTGLEALALATIGAQVSVLDHMPAALALVQRNCARNHLAPLTTHLCCWQDRRALRRLPPYELVIGSDVLYDAAAARGVYRLLRHVLLPQGQALIADPLRAEAHGVSLFLALMTKAGATHTARWLHAVAYGRPHRSRLYTVTACTMTGQAEHPVPSGLEAADYTPPAGPGRRRTVGTRLRTQSHRGTAPFEELSPRYGEDSSYGQVGRAGAWAVAGAWTRRPLTRTVKAIPIVRGEGVMASKAAPVFVPIPADARAVIRETRTLVGLSRPTLEQRAKVGVDYVKKLELGRRPSAEVTRLRRVLQVVQQAAARGQAPAKLQTRIARVVKTLEPQSQRGKP